MVPARKRTKTKDSDPLFAIPKDGFIIEPLQDADAQHGFFNTGYIPPSRHLRAAQAAAAQTSVYRTTSKQERQQSQAATKDPTKKLTAQEVEDYLKAEGLIDESSTISDNFENPYVDLDMWKMHDTWRRDNAAKRAISVLADFTLGQRTKNTLDANHQEYADEEQQKQDLEVITSNPTYQAYLYQLDCLNRDVDFDYNLTAAFIQCKVFGRAMLLIQDDPDTGLPIALKLVSSMRLGRVFVDELTWKVVAVEYLDYEGLESIIPAQKMIYFRNQDYAISPNCFGFGYSDLEPVLDIAETNRQLWSVAIKEINKSQWAPYLIVKVNSKRKSQLQKIADSLKPGLPFVHNQDIAEIQTIEMHHDLEKIMQEIDVNERTIAYTIGVPTFLMGKEDVTNRATTATIMDAWTKSKLEKERTWLRGIIEPQWIDRNLDLLIKSGIVERSLPQDKPAMISTQYPDPRTGKPVRGNVNPNNPFAFGGGNGKTKPANAAMGDTPNTPYSQAMPSQKSPQTNAPNQDVGDQYPPTQAISPDTPISKLEFKIKFEFEPIVLDTLFETAAPIVQLIQAGVIDETAARDFLHFQSIEARMKSQEAQNQQMAQMIAQGQAAQFQQMNSAEKKAMQQQNQQDKQQQQNPAGQGQGQGQGQKGSVPQVGQGLGIKPTGLAQGSYPSTNSAIDAAAKLRMQADKRRLMLYEEISQAVQSITSN